jgi:CRISPR-associated endonuclease/helicase Cas3
MPIYAHTKKDPATGQRLPESEWQSLDEHLTEVATTARTFAEEFGAGDCAYVAGLLHDIGKATQEFQDYLIDETKKRGSIPHSIYGAKRVCEIFTQCTQPQLPVAEMLTNVILSHHGGLRDFLTPDGNAELHDQLSDTKKISLLTKYEYNPVDLTSEIKVILEKVPHEISDFAKSMLTKLLYSCLVDADRLNAYEFETGAKHLPIEANWSEMISKLDDRLSSFECETAMDILRAGVSADCAKAGERERGIYKLEIPTGGGKTLASMRFALIHAKKHKLDRIIIVIPYLSIIDQTAKELREVFGDVVLEHHSNFFPDNPEYYKLQIDRWDAPIVITTQVQFLESIFSNRGGDLRKLHNMANSVIIFDEVQSLPVKCVHLFNCAVNFLHKVCESSFLLCTATQPLLDEVLRPIIFTDKQSIATCNISMRTEIVNTLRPAGYSASDLATFVLDKHKRSTLVILNTKIAAKNLYTELKKSGKLIVHLSTNMCHAHRDVVFSEIRRRLQSVDEIICVSTQLIEAGVDLSFQCVVRDIAGLDSIYQAAGRCNRHGEINSVMPVYVVNVSGENLSRLPDIKIGADVTRRLFDENNLNIKNYYEYYFHRRKCEMDFNTHSYGSVYDLLAVNKEGRKAYRNKGGVKKIALTCAIRSAAEEFYVIAPGRTNIIVYYGESAKILGEYESTNDFNEKYRLLRILGKYSVQVYKFQIDELERHGALSERNGLTVLSKGFYNSECGLDIDGSHELLCV